MRGYLAAATLRLLSFSDRDRWAMAIDRQTDQDVGEGNSILLAGHLITRAQARTSARIVAETIARMPASLLNHHSLADIQDWRDSDEKLVADLRRVLLAGDHLPPALPTGVYATHVVAAAVTTAIAGAATPARIFPRMIRLLKSLHTRNPTWGPLAVAHRGNLAKRRLF